MAVTDVSQRIRQPRLLEKNRKEVQKLKQKLTKSREQLNHNKSSSLQLVYFKPEQTVQMAL